MNLFENAKAIAEAEANCLGQKYRYVESIYKGKDHSLVFTKKLRPLHRSSCQGCSVCGGGDGISIAMSEFPQNAIEFPDTLKTNTVVELVLVIDSCDPATGYVEEYHYKAVPVPQPKIT